MLKALIVFLILCLWASCIAGHDTKPTSKIAHVAIHAGYAAFVAAVILCL